MNSYLAQLEEKLSHDHWDPVPERASLWAELKELLSDYPKLRTYLVLPEDLGSPEPSSAASTGTGPPTGAGASTGQTSTQPGASTAYPSSLEGCLVRSVLNAPSWERHSSPPHASWGCHGWLWVALRTLKERPCCSRPNKRPRHGRQPHATCRF